MEQLMSEGFCENFQVNLGACEITCRICSPRWTTSLMDDRVRSSLRHHCDASNTHRNARAEVADDGQRTLFGAVVYQKPAPPPRL